MMLVEKLCQIGQRGNGKKTSLLVNSTNPKRLKVYEAELPAGHVEFGANRDGLTARKGGYLIAVRPKLLKPDGSISDESSILPLLENANTRRGRDLFFSTNGANCSSCHQVGQLGNNHAPTSQRLVHVLMQIAHPVNH